MSTEASAQQVTAAYSGREATYEPSEAFRRQAHIGSMEEYEEMYQRSVDDTEAFWAEQAERIDWFEPFQRVKNVSYEPSTLHIGWYLGGKLNASYNCLDRHLEERGDKTALIFERDDPNEEAEHITYRELHARVCRFANVLKKHDVEKGDRVTIYLPMIPEAAVAMLACARIGAIHSVVFAGFSPEALSDRLLNCESDVLITADEGIRGGSLVPLKENADKALEHCPDVRRVIIVQNSGNDIDWDDERDVWYHEEVATVGDECEPEVMDAEDPLFILYTSGSTGKPKGVVHTTGGYMVYSSLTHELIFDVHEDDVYWCTADVGWITGHSYIVYGPLANGCTQVFFEGKPTYPTPSRLWEIVDNHEVSIFYTAPTAIRALMREGEEHVTKTDRSSLRVLGTVGEPINPEAWRWYHEVIGNGNCPIVDTWWQTETGGIMISGLPGATTLKPGSATLPFFGVQPAVVRKDGSTVKGEGEGLLVMRDSWPGQARTVYKDHERFVSTYFVQHEGNYFSGDGCRRDADGYYWITGRVDDVLIVSGHRMGTAEVESALVQHDAVVEAAVVGYPHDVKGQGIYAYVTLSATHEPGDELRDELIEHVRETLGPIAKPDKIQFADALPKTRSGKIMRRILRKIAAGQHDELGDTSTLADASVVETLIEERV